MSSPAADGVVSAQVVLVGIDGVVRRAVDRDRRRRRIDDGDCLRVADGVVAAIVGRPHVEMVLVAPQAAAPELWASRTVRRTLAIVHGRQRALRGTPSSAHLNGQVAGIGRPVAVRWSVRVIPERRCRRAVAGTPRPRSGADVLVGMMVATIREATLDCRKSSVAVAKAGQLVGIEAPHLLRSRGGQARSAGR